MQLNKFIELALAEDIGDGDHTSLATIPANAQKKARLLVKDDGILAGVELAQRIFHQYNPSFKIEFLKKDGDPVKKGDVAFLVEGPARDILSCERLVLNCMQRMSGIATLTHQINQELHGLNTKLLDTRKTTPLFRYMEKWAVKIGGGVNHRFALYDMIMIKDNHVDYAGGIANAINNTKKYLQDTGKDLKIEVEARTLDDIKEILKHEGVFRVLIDNFSPEKLAEAVKLVNGQIETEASGGITIETIRSYALTGVDYISCGALTHSYKSLDLSLKAYE
ncbi:MAG TPA: carboxylating nicotinate-nucleotide diphosphorylase [Flavobacteriales bacterium]|nr:carboxylating nicotinate-nucleotide diphosphorylase [Flavobacteriales bacterium]